MADEELGGQLPLNAAAYQILLALADGDKHGYAIMQEVSTRTGGQTRLGPGTLYGTIKRLLQAGLIEEADERPDPHLDDQRRRYYRMTDHGRRIAVVETQRLAELVQTALTKKLIRTLDFDPGRG